MAKSKRQRKKQAKKQVQALFAREGYTKQQVQRMDSATRKKEEQRLARNAKRREQYAQEKKRLQAWAKKEGISLTLLKKKGLTGKDLSALTTKQKSDLKRRTQKAAELDRLGIKYKAGDLSLGWEKLRQKYGDQVTPPDSYKPRKPRLDTRTRMTGSTYLYIGAAEVQGGFSLPNLSGVDDGRLIDLINRRAKDAVADPSSSADLFCVFQSYYGTQQDCMTVANFYYKRGYNLTPERQKFNQERYNKVTISNSFSQREFHEMIYTCISQMKNEDVPGFMSEMEAFCDANGFPFMRNLK